MRNERGSMAWCARKPIHLIFHNSNRGFPMTRFLSTLAALAVLTGTAMAADAPGTVKAPGKVSANYDWRGVYVGIEGGYAFGNADGAVTLGGTTFGADYDIKGYLYGIKIGA